VRRILRSAKLASPQKRRRILGLGEGAVDEQTVTGDLLLQVLERHILAAEELGDLIVRVGDGGHCLNRRDCRSRYLLPLSDFRGRDFGMVAEAVSGLHGEDEQIGRSARGRFVDGVIGVAEARQGPGEAIEFGALVERASRAVNTNRNRLGYRNSQLPRSSLGSLGISAASIRRCLRDQSWRSQEIVPTSSPRLLLTRRIVCPSPCRRPNTLLSRF